VTPLNRPSAISVASSASEAFAAGAVESSNRGQATEDKSSGYRCTALMPFCAKLARWLPIGLPGAAVVAQYTDELHLSHTLQGYAIST
jgi:hypothetical protein